MSLRDVGWIWEGQGLDPGVRPSIYGLGQGAAYMGLSRVNFMFHPNDEHALRLLGDMDEVTCDISKWDFEWGEHNTVRAETDGRPETVRREAIHAAELSTRFANVTGLFDDDVMGLMKRHGMTIEQFGDMRRAVADINGNLKLWTVVYTHELGEVEFWQSMSPYLDVVNLWIWESKNIPTMPQELERCREVFPDKPIVMGVYLRNYSTAAPVPVESVMMQMKMIAEAVERGDLAGYSILGSVLIEGQRAQADAIRDFIASQT